ncbi:YqgE/AlgH family protein [Parabacteroides sp. 52]|uniref:YqgE/AlgH family protein n=1 Tax=unclassified Parabacteroides TaxID=2649774 RepID=UPI0013D84C4A|nr:MULTISPECIES: YqgE/AlgH family protein [unclassified Parabacteroides]MDH6533885.1 putative transcriptional regulator [Parabacteroides sp. PM5-20]NDV54630.1 YqgE/AlgH family protein [Parabacteroides sp. 52]
MSTYKNIFRVTHNNLYPAPGNILISEPALQNLYFQRSVVLLVEHNAKGSMGFVLNKKTDLYVNTFFSDLEYTAPIPIYLGGPVSANRLFFIHSLGDIIIPDAVKINEQLYFDGDFNALKKYISKGQSIEGKVKFFLGYSGWTAGQLSREIDSNSWVVSQPNNASVIPAEGDSYWKDSLQRLGQDYKTWINYPKDPNLN